MSSTTASQRGNFASMALLVAEEAGALVAAGYRSRPVPDRKGRNDLVTEYDRASEALLVSRLGSLSAGIPVVGEEAASAGKAAGGEGGGLVWYVDPIDGTTNFVHGHPFWCISVGLMEDGQPIAGAVVAPALGVRWIGWVDPERPEGARPLSSTVFRNGAPCSVSATTELADSLLATGFPANRDQPPHDNFGSFISVKRIARAVRRCGSAALDLCLVADGTYDGYWERKLHPWDITGGGAILLAAGGTITSLGGAPADFVEGTVVASNGLIHRELVTFIGG